MTLPSSVRCQHWQLAQHLTRKKLPPAVCAAAASAAAVLGVASDFVAEVLDRQHGAQVTDSNIFRQHAAKYEVCEGGGERVCACACVCVRLWVLVGAPYKPFCTV